VTWTPCSNHKTRMGRPKWRLVKAGTALRTAGTARHPDGHVWTCNTIRCAENKAADLNGLPRPWSSYQARDERNK
jgi:hypothetical protein